MKKQLCVLGGVFLLLTLLIFSAFLVLNRKEVVLDDVSLKDYTDNKDDMFAIMVENDNGEYEEYADSSSWPTGMFFNKEYSGCVDASGNTVNATLSYSDGYVSVSTNDTVYCYLYFDIDNGWCLNNGITNLAECVLQSENESDNVDDAVTYIESKGTPDFSVTATADEGLYYATDDYGDSYYFRGAVTDNYVYFAGYYWRIIRINGDGSIRMIYDGSTQAYDNGDSSTDRYVSTSRFNLSHNSNAYVGYMYGAAYTDAESNTIKTTLTLQDYYYYYSSSYTFDTETGYYTLSDDAVQQVWNSGLVDYYTCKSTSTTCTTLYKISSYRDIYRGYYYTYNSTSSTDGNVTTYVESHGTSTTSGTFATRYYYGTGYTYDSGNGYTLTDYAYNIYDGTGTITDLTDYYTCGSTVYSSTGYTGCATIYHIESASTAQTANVTEYSLTTSSSYDTTHANINNSAIKTAVDNWYYTNVYNTTDGTNSYDDYISDTSFCNDRSVYSGTGIGTTETFYSAYNRSITNKSPILTCPNKTNDAFTVDDTVNGNGALTYKVGLITADEVVLAGGVSHISNTSYYLYIGDYYWTMSPGAFTEQYAYEMYFDISDGIAGNFVVGALSVRPVINLLPTVVITSGDGTKDSPYEVALS